MGSSRYLISVLRPGAKGGAHEVYHAHGATEFHMLLASLRQRLGPRVRLHIRAVQGDSVRGRDGTKHAPAASAEQVEALERRTPRAPRRMPAASGQPGSSEVIADGSQAETEVDP